MEIQEIKKVPKKFETSRQCLQYIFFIAELVKKWGQHPELMRCHYRLKKQYFNLRESEGYQDSPVTLGFSGRD
jgi:hypothetical protein